MNQQNWMNHEIHETHENNFIPRRGAESAENLKLGLLCDPYGSKHWKF